MKIECFFSEGCSSKEKLKENIRQALLEEGMEARIYSPEVSEEE